MMAIWKESDSEKTTHTEEAIPEESATSGERIENVSGQAKTDEFEESVITEDLSIEGKIEGSGHVRLIGKFKGDVQVKGDLTIEPGAKVSGGVRAERVVIGGELEGNIDAASSVELLESAVVNGDVKADSVSVAAGSRMRGQVEFGWNEEERRSRKDEAQVRLHE